MGGQTDDGCMGGWMDECMSGQSPASKGLAVVWRKVWQTFVQGSVFVNSFIGKQPFTFVCISSMPAFVLQWQR